MKKDCDADNSDSEHEATGIRKSVSFNASQGKVNKKKIVFYVDSGCSDHLINDRRFLQSIRRLKDPFVVDVAKAGVSLEGKLEGLVRGTTLQGTRFEMKNVVYLPQLRGNLLSVKRLSKAGIDVLFTNDGGEKAVLKIKGDVIAVAYLKNNLYELELDVEMGEADSEGVLKRSPFKKEVREYKSRIIPVCYQQEGIDEDDDADNGDDGVKTDDDDGSTGSSDEGAAGGAEPKVTNHKMASSFVRRDYLAKSKAKQRVTVRGVPAEFDSDDGDESWMDADDYTGSIRSKVMLAINTSKISGKPTLSNRLEHRRRPRRGITFLMNTRNLMDPRKCRSRGDENEVGREFLKRSSCQIFSH